MQYPTSTYSIQIIKFLFFCNYLNIQLCINTAKVAPMKKKKFWQNANVVNGQVTTLATSCSYKCNTEGVRKWTFEEVKN